MPLDTKNLIQFTLTSFRPSEPKVTVNKDGTVSFWQGSTRKYKLNEVPFVVFYYDTKNKAGSWASNPWVWVVVFKRVEQNDN